MPGEEILAMLHERVELQHLTLERRPKIRAFAHSSAATIGTWVDTDLRWKSWNGRRDGPAKAWKITWLGRYFPPTSA